MSQTLMSAEISEAPEVFKRSTNMRLQAQEPRLKTLRAIYTVARGSSDAAATAINYELMRLLRIPCTSLPPSVFSIGEGVTLDGCAVIVISQSGESPDLVQSARDAKAAGALVIVMTNHPDAPLMTYCDMAYSIEAGPERAVPATKTIIGTLGAAIGLMGLLGGARELAEASGALQIDQSTPSVFPTTDFQRALTESSSIYVIGRGAGLGVAQEIALKIKETCAIHAEAYSSSEVLHGPLQLVTRGLTAIAIDLDQKAFSSSLETAADALAEHGADILRVGPKELGLRSNCALQMAARALFLIYLQIEQATRSLGLDPDSPKTLKKVTQTK